MPLGAPAGRNASIGISDSGRLDLTWQEGLANLVGILKGSSQPTAPGILGRMNS